MCHVEQLEPPATGRDESLLTRRVGPVGVRVHEPAAGGPPVVVVPDFFGPSPFYEALAGRLCGSGYTAVVVDPYHDLPPVSPGDADAALARLAQRGDDEAIDDLLDAVGAARRWTGARTCGVIGFCAGGTWAMCLAERPDLAAVAFYGFPAGLPVGEGRRVPEHRTDRLRSPLLALWGDEDEAVGHGPIRRYVDAVGERATTVVYPGVGHGFLQGLFVAEGPTAPVARTAWDTTRTFLGQHVGLATAGR